MAVGRTILSFCVIAALSGCGPKQPPPAPSPEAETEVEAEAEPTSAGDVATQPSRPSTPAARKKTASKPSPPVRRVAVRTEPPRSELWKEISGERAWRTARLLTEVGPRPAGSMELGRARAMLVSALESQAWEVEQQAFTATSTRGELQGTNLIARFSADGVRPVPRETRSILVGAHYDTRLFSTIRFVGANDGASGPAVLLEVARVLALDPQLAANVEIVLFDAGEPRSQFSPTDGLFGSKHYVETAAAGLPKEVIIVQSVGDATSPLMLPAGTSAEVAARVRAATSALQTSLEFKTAPVRLWGDHLPFGERALVLGNYDAVFRYTADDTIDKVDPATMAHVGELIVWMVKQAAKP